MKTSNLFWQCVSAVLFSVRRRIVVFRRMDSVVASQGDGSKR